MRIKSFIFVLAATFIGTAAFAQDGVMLTHRLSEGDQFEMNVRSEMATCCIGEVESGTVTEFSYLMDVQEVQENGNALIKITYQNVEISGENGMNFDSDTPQDEVPLPLRPMSSLCGQSITMVMTPCGEIVELRGMCCLMKNLMKEIADDDEEMQELVMNAMQELFSDDALKNSFSQLLPCYPCEAVDVDSSWTNHYELMGFTVDQTLTVKELGEDTAVIAFDGGMTSGADGMEINAGIGSANLALNGTNSGTMEIDLNTGFVKSLTMTDDVKGEVKAEDQTLPISFTTTTVMTTRKL